MEELVQLRRVHPGVGGGAAERTAAPPLWSAAAHSPTAARRTTRSCEWHWRQQTHRKRAVNASRNGSSDSCDEELCEEGVIKVKKDADDAEPRTFQTCWEALHGSNPPRGSDCVEVRSRDVTDVWVVRSHRRSVVACSCEWSVSSRVGCVVRERRVVRESPRPQHPHPWAMRPCLTGGSRHRRPGPGSVAVCCVQCLDVLYRVPALLLWRRLLRTARLCVRPRWPSHQEPDQPHRLLSTVHCVRDLPPVTRRIAHSLPTACVAVHPPSRPLYNPERLAVIREVSIDHGTAVPLATLHRFLVS